MSPKKEKKNFVVTFAIKGEGYIFNEGQFWAIIKRDTVPVRVASVEAAWIPRHKDYLIADGVGGRVIDVICDETNFIVHCVIAPVQW
jgi:hypothetical protein